MLAENRIVLDLSKAESQAGIYVKQHDTGRVLHFVIVDHGEPFALDNCVVWLRAKLPSDTSTETLLYNECETKNNIASYSFTEMTTVSPGILECELYIYIMDNTRNRSPLYAGNRLLSTCRFTMNVVEAVTQSDEIVTASNEFTLLLNAIAAANNLNISASQTENGLTISITNKAGETHTYTISGGTVSGDSGSTGGGSSVTTEYVDLAINRAIGQLQSGYDTIVDADKTSVPTTYAVWTHVNDKITSTLMLISDDVNLLIDSKLAEIVNGDEVAY